jgi:ascorbate-specific PTS system EIIC-type component UlaA
MTGTLGVSAEAAGGVSSAMERPDVDVVLYVVLTGENGTNAAVCSAKSRLMTAAVANFMMSVLLILMSVGYVVLYFEYFVLQYLQSVEFVASRQRRPTRIGYD